MLYEVLDVHSLLAKCGDTSMVLYIMDYFYIHLIFQYFSVIAGCISFWLPGSVIMFVYASVYRETRRLNKQTQARLGQLSQTTVIASNTNMTLTQVSKKEIKVL